VSKRNQCLLIAAIVVIGSVVWLGINRRPSTAASGSAQVAQPSSSASGQGRGASETASGVTPAKLSSLKPAVPTAPQLETVVPKSGGEPAKVVRVRAEQVLATVNGVGISLRDLAAIDTQSGADQLLSPEMYEFLLNRAIDREVTLQTARAQGLELAAEQKAQLEQMRAALAKQDSKVVRQLTTTAASIEFDVRDASGLMLQTALAAKAGLPSPHVTPEKVEQYYQSHKDEFGELPSDPATRQATWQTINLQVRRKLSPIVRAEYQEKLRQYFDALKAQANIKTASLSFAPQ
jgi:hypothetical protein